MKIEVLENEKNRLLFELKGADHTFCNVLKKELLGVKGVELATYAIEHPQSGVPKILIETKDSLSPKQALEKAVVSLKKDNKEFLKLFQSIAK